MATNHFLTGLYLDPLPGKWKMDEHGIIWSFSSDFHQVSMVLRGFVGRILNWDRQWHRLPVAIHGGSPHLINSLVGGLEHVLLVLFHIFGISSSQLTNSYFSIPPTSSWLGFLGSPESQPAHRRSSLFLAHRGHRPRDLRALVTWKKKTWDFYGGFIEAQRCDRWWGVELVYPAWFLHRKNDGKIHHF